MRLAALAAVQAVLAHTLRGTTPQASPPEATPGENKGIPGGVLRHSPTAARDRQGGHPGEAELPARELCSKFVERASLPGNILFVKTAKTGGSSWGGVLRRLGCRHGYDDVFRYGMSGGARSHALFANHITRPDLQHELAQNPRPNAQWVTIMRDPAERCMSDIYHRGLSQPHSPTDPAGVEALKLAWLRSSKCVDAQAHQLQTAGKKQFAWEIAKEYDFIALTERFDESLLLLKHRWSLELVDLLYLRSKDAEAGGHRLAHMVPHVPISEESEAVQHEYARLVERNKRDVSLHRLAADRLDAQKAQIPGFDRELAWFKSMLATAEETCRSEFKITWQDANGHSGCMWGDNGCAQQCLNRLARDSHWT